jgi:P-type E1-E2 ATPase
LRSASSVLAALAKRMPSIAHRKRATEILDVALAEIAVGDTLVIYPHEICPADGVVIEGHGVMDESYLTGEPFKITKTSGSAVISGAINGESALTIRTTQARGRFALREDHGSHARVRGKAAAVAAARRSTGSDLHSGGRDRGRFSLDNQW